MNRDFVFWWLSVVNKEWWQGSEPISRTLPHSKALAHWRQVWRNYLFQGGYPRYHLICTPPRRGSPSWFPQSPRTVGYGPQPLEVGLELLFQGGYPRYHTNCTPPGGPPSWAPTPSRPSTFYPQPVCYFLNVVSLGQLWLGLKIGLLIYFYCVWKCQVTIWNIYFIIYFPATKTNCKWLKNSKIVYYFWRWAVDLYLSSWKGYVSLCVECQPNFGH